MARPQPREPLPRRVHGAGGLLSVYIGVFHEAGGSGVASFDEVISFSATARGGLEAMESYVFVGANGNGISQNDLTIVKTFLIPYDTNVGTCFQ